MKTYTQLQEIPNNTIEGRLLRAALAKITTESQTDKTPDEVISQLNELSQNMFKDEPSELALSSFSNDELQAIKTDLSHILRTVDLSSKHKDIRISAIEKINGNKPEVVDINIFDVIIITNNIIKYFPRFFGDYKDWCYANGADAGNDFKKIFNRAVKISKKLL